MSQLQAPRIAAKWAGVVPQKRAGQTKNEACDSWGEGITAIQHLRMVLDVLCVLSNLPRAL